LTAPWLENWTSKEKKKDKTKGPIKGSLAVLLALSFVGLLTVSANGTPVERKELDAEN